MTRFDDQGPFPPLDPSLDPSMRVRARQVAKRVKTLLPQRLRQIEREYRLRFPAAKAQRYALNDERYLAFVDQAAHCLAIAIEARIQWETKIMLFDARRHANSKIKYPAERR